MYLCPPVTGWPNLRKILSEDYQHKTFSQKHLVYVSCLIVKNRKEENHMVADSYI
jgi:hypothetical protein